MGEALIFILQRLYISFASGSIINFYIIYTFFVLEREKLLPKWLLVLKDIGFSSTVFIWIFVFSALIIGIFLEGFTQGGVELYKENIDKYIKQDKKNTNDENEFNNLNITGKIVYLLFIKSTVTEACIYYWKQQQQKQQNEEEINISFKFLHNLNIGNLPCNQNEIFLIVQTIALKISKRLGNNDLYRFRDLSFMVQILRSSFLLISSFSFIITICVATVNYMKDGWNNEEKLLLYFPVCFIISVVFVILTTKIAKNFSRRYLRELGSYYNALDFDKEPQKS